MTTTDERLDALESRVHNLEEMRLAYEARLIAHDRLLQAATTNDSAHVIELRNLRSEMEQLRAAIQHLGADILHLGSGMVQLESGMVQVESGMVKFQSGMSDLGARTAAGFEALDTLIRRGLNLPED